MDDLIRPTGSVAEIQNMVRGGCDVPRPQMVRRMTGCAEFASANQPNRRLDSECSSVAVGCIPISSRTFPSGFQFRVETKAQGFCESLPLVVRSAISGGWVRVHVVSVIQNMNCVQVGFVGTEKLFLIHGSKDRQPALGKAVTRVTTSSEILWISRYIFGEVER